MEHAPRLESLYMHGVKTIKIRRTETGGGVRIVLIGSNGYSTDISVWSELDQEPTLDVDTYTFGKEDSERKSVCL